MRMENFGYAMSDQTTKTGAIMNHFFFSYFEWISKPFDIRTELNC